MTAESAFGSRQWAPGGRISPVGKEVGPGYLSSIFPRRREAMNTKSRPIASR